MKKEESKQDIGGSNVEVLLTSIDVVKDQDFWSGRQRK